MLQHELFCTEIAVRMTASAIMTMIWNHWLNLPAVAMVHIAHILVGSKQQLSAAEAAKVSWVHATTDALCGIVHNCFVPAASSVATLQWGFQRLASVCFHLQAPTSGISSFTLILCVRICNDLSQCVAKDVPTIRQSACELAVSVYCVDLNTHNVVRSTCRSSDRSLRFLWPLGRWAASPRWWYTSTVDRKVAPPGD